MPLAPDSSPEKFSREVLRVIYDHGMLRGKDIKRGLNISDDGKLRAALVSLVKEKLVTIQSGSVALESERGALDSYVAPLPSGQANAAAVLSHED